MKLCYSLIAVLLLSCAQIRISHPGRTIKQSRIIRTVKVSTLEKYNNKTFPLHRTIDGKTTYNNKFSPYPYSDLHYPIPILYDLKFVYSLNEIHLYNDGPVDSIRQFRLLYSTDNKQYHHLYTSDNLKDLNYNIVLTFPVIRARYIKLEILGAYGIRPEFREITFYSVKPIIIPKKKKYPKKRPVAFEDSIQILEINPYCCSIPDTDVKIQQDNRYFYNEDLIEIKLTNINHHYLELSFYEAEPINREIKLTIPEINYSTNIFVNERERVLHYIDLSIEGFSNYKPYSIILENLAGPNVSFNELSIYRKEIKVKELIYKTLNAYRVKNKITLNEFLKDKSINDMINNIRKHYLSLLYNDTDAFIDMNFGFDLLNYQENSVMDLMVSFEEETSSNYNNHIYHFRMPVLDPGDNKPSVDIIKHIGQTHPFRTNILNNNYYSNFNGFISISNNIHLTLKIPFPKELRKNKHLSINYIITNEALPEAIYLASTSTSPEYFNRVNLKPFIQKSVKCKNE